MKPKIMHIVTDEDGESRGGLSQTGDALDCPSDKATLSRQPNTEWVFVGYELPGGYTYPTEEQLKCLPEGSKVLRLSTATNFGWYSWGDTGLIGQAGYRPSVYCVPKTPPKTPQQLKIEELEKTINEAQQQIAELKEQTA